MNAFTNGNTYSGSNQYQYGADTESVTKISKDWSFGGLHGAAMAAMAIVQDVLLTANYNNAENYYKTNKKDFDFFVSTYETNMKNALTEAMSRPLYESGAFTPQYGTRDYISNTGRGFSAGARHMDKQWFATRKRMQKYHVGLGHWIDYKFGFAKYNAALEGWNLGFRYEDTRTQMYDEQRHANRTNILNLGIGVGNSARAGLATATGTLANARSEMASNLASISNGAGQALGYGRAQKAISGLSTQQLANATSRLMGTYEPPSYEGTRQNTVGVLRQDSNG